jgi:EAL domain-containing protein (putative c-di-GMP-specific phosphodiesterase class I)
MSTPSVASAAVPSGLEELAGTYAQRITAALPLRWAQRLSMHDSRGNVCWQSAGVWGPAERDAVRLAVERFGGNSAPARADHELPEQRTAVLLRASDASNTFRGFIMLIVDSRRLKGKGQAFFDLPVPVQRAAHDWAARLASAQGAQRHGEAAPRELSPAQVERLVAFGPAVDEPQMDAVFTRLRSFQVALVAQSLAPLQRGMRVRRFEVFLREAASSGATAPVSLLREADYNGLGTVLDRRVAGALIVWLSKRSSMFADEPEQFSVNLSASSLSDPNFLRFIELCTAKAGISPALVAFEVDQAFWRKDRQSVERLCQGIDAIGAGIVIDNGSLHEETPELLSLPGVRLVKIDRALTTSLADSQVAQMRIAGIAQIARIAGVHTVAKQIERPEEQELLRALGVDFMQGHATAVPTPLETLDRQREEQLVVDEAACEGETHAPG